MVECRTGQAVLRPMMIKVNKSLLKIKQIDHSISGFKKSEANSQFIIIVKLR